MPVAVSSAMPKRPGPRAASTSSEVAPASAISTSWMTPAPFNASAETRPRSIRSISTGDRPALMTCAPRPHTIGAPAARAATIASTTAVNSAAASSFGSRATNVSTLAPGTCGAAKSSRRTLLGRDASG